MRYLIAQNGLDPTAAEVPERERAVARIQERIEELLAGRTAYAADYPLPSAA